MSDTRTPSPLSLREAAKAVVDDARDQGRDDCFDDLVDEQHIERLRHALRHPAPPEKPPFPTVDPPERDTPAKAANRFLTRWGIGVVADDGSPHPISVELASIIERGDPRHSDAWKARDDRPLPEDPQIEAAFPTRSGRHDLYGEAMRFVGARYTKGGLVALVNWLLHRIESAPQATPKEDRDHECG